jgi:hypothetical protein
LLKFGQDVDARHKAGHDELCHGPSVAFSAVTTFSTEASSIALSWGVDCERE